ncbi:hypothetical protein BDY17DRAFT_310361 [Neohortaea acidophila]|uniref:Uncharacterized protein n=1 Tax=Neohortaea acidophila TaxID=245834 RepID=A0A6A6PTA1_9PEZI|nr:uncharacterized protein BDY17DRAFT_310361 [Neohortaea acidophila]KAF2483330.1 hypothetical protein BDY17DRAFT_310361 [Neohortaea acidophila]
MDRSPLGALAPELRNRIYELALYERRPVSISKNFWAEAALLRTCKQVRQEAELLFYSINDFIFVTDLQENEDWKRLLHWVQRAPTQKFALIKSFTVQVEAPGRELPWYCRRNRLEIVKSQKL